MALRGYFFTMVLIWRISAFSLCFSFAVVPATADCNARGGLEVHSNQYHCPGVIKKPLVRSGFLEGIVIP